MFVKVVRREVTEGNVTVSLFECEAVHIRPCQSQHLNTPAAYPRGATTLSLQPDGPEVVIGRDENGKAEADVYFLNNDGQTIDKVM